MVRYHSAMKKYGGVAKSTVYKDTNVYEYNGSYVLHNDICDKSIPEMFKKADAVLVVMSWRAGYKHFTENSIAKDTSFLEYCEGIHRAIAEIGKPSFVITNKTFAKHLKAERLVPIIFDRFKSNDLCAIWNYDGDIPEHTTELMQWVGQNYDTVLDFCCGYGEVLTYCKHFIASDINTGCLDYVKEAILYGKSKQGNTADKRGNQ